LIAAAGLLLALAVAWLAQPLWLGDEPAPPPDARAIALLSEREMVLAMIRDLDTDLALERIGSIAHGDRRVALVDRAAGVLAALDRLQAETSGEAARRAARIEAEVSARATTDPGDLPVPTAPAVVDHGGTSGVQPLSEL
jgi:hypothetical protein